MYYLGLNKKKLIMSISRNKFKEHFLTQNLTLLLSLVGFGVTIYVARNTPNISGTSLFFLLPLTFTACCIFFMDIIPYHRDGFGLKVLYSVLVVRYLVIPFLTCYVGFFSGSLYSADAYTYGIIMQIVELIVTCAIVKYYFQKTYKKCKAGYHSKAKRLEYDSLTLGGVLVLLFTLYVIYSRGLGKLLDSMRFLVLSEGIEEEAFYGYDIWMVHTAMAFLVIVVTGTFQRKEDVRPSIFNVVLPLTVAFFSCALSFGNNRMTMVYYAISALAILLIAFPRQKAFVSGTIIPTFLIVIVSFTMIKQFGYNIEKGGDTGLREDDIVTTVSAYVSTTQNIAKAYDMYKLHGDQMSVGSVVADVINGVTILQLPMFSSVRNIAKSSPTSISLASTSTEVVPMAGQTLFYGGYWLGWLLDIAFFIIIIRLLLLTDCYSKMEKRLGNKYLLTWVSVTFAMIMTYNLSIIWSSLNATPLFTLCALWINRKIRINKSFVKSRNG